MSEKIKILVTGGIGFIGSHTCVELSKYDYEIVIVENLSNSKIEMVEKNLEYYRKENNIL